MGSKQKKRRKSQHRAARRDKLRLTHSRPPAGSHPGTLVFREGSPVPLVHALRYTSEVIEEREIRSEADLGAFCEKGGNLWIDVQGLGDRAVLEWIGKRFGLHPLVLADIVHVSQRPKSERYEGSIFTVARRLKWKGDPEDLVDEAQVSVVIAPGYVLSFQEQEDDVFNPVKERLKLGIGIIRAAGPDYLGYALLDAVIDGYLPVMDKVGEILGSLEQRALVHPTRALTAELSLVRRDLLAIRRDVWPQREALHALLRGDAGEISEPVRVYLRDVHDHCVQVAEMVDVYREIGAELHNMYVTTLTNRTNEVMKVLTVVASIFIPLTFLVGVWGMNFEHMPELSTRWGYPAVLALLLVIGVSLGFYFRRKGWIGRSQE